MRPGFVMMLLLITGLSAAQEGLVAYVPKQRIAHSADSQEIGLTSTSEQGVYAVQLPNDTYKVDMLDERGDLLMQQPSFIEGRLDIRGMKAATYTLRAHTHKGIRIRRFALLGKGSSLWAVDAEPVR